MKSVLRYELSPTSDGLRAPFAKVTRAEHTDRDTVEFWVEADPHAPTALYWIVGTGHDFAAEASVVATTTRRDGLVWHLVRAA